MLSKQKKCDTLGVQLDGDKVYESKSWPNIKGFVDGDAIQLLCRGSVPYKHGKPNAHSLTPIMI